MPKRLHPPKVALDSQCFSYMLDALETVSEPTDALADERKALVRIWFYTPETYYLTQTVVDEFMAIGQVARRENHLSWKNSLFHHELRRNPEAIEVRVTELSRLHAGQNDCRVLAEAEDTNIAVLLSRDARFLRRLGSVPSPTTLQRPSVYWSMLGIAHGERPVTVPHETNPLAHENWWRW